MIISGIVVFGQWPAPATLVGAALVVACGAYLAVKERKGRHVPMAAVVDVDPKV
jgi:drug/metabolite transporter (DMT)-like permease